MRELTPAEREAFGKAPFCEAAYRKGLGIRSTQGETGYTTMERTGIRPSLDVNGIWSGYTGEGTKTVIPSKACGWCPTRITDKSPGCSKSTCRRSHLRA